MSETKWEHYPVYADVEYLIHNGVWSGGITPRWAEERAREWGCDSTSPAVLQHAMQYEIERMRRAISVYEGAFHKVEDLPCLPVEARLEAHVKRIVQNALREVKEFGLPDWWEIRWYNLRIIHEKMICFGALNRIRDATGRVCPEFETCAHPACADSAMAWRLAGEALKELAEFQKSRTVSDGQKEA